MLVSSLKRFLGIGNVMGLGMAFFVVSYFELLYHWFHVCESVFVRVWSMENISLDDVKRVFEF